MQQPQMQQTRPFSIFFQRFTQQGCPHVHTPAHMRPIGAASGRGRTNRVVASKDAMETVNGQPRVFIAVGVVAQIIDGSEVPFFPGITNNLMDFIKSLGSSGGGDYASLSHLIAGAACARSDARESRAPRQALRRRRRTALRRGTAQPRARRHRGCG